MDPSEPELASLGFGELLDQLLLGDEIAPLSGGVAENNSLDDKWTSFYDSHYQSLNRENNSDNKAQLHTCDDPNHQVLENIALSYSQPLSFAHTPINSITAAAAAATDQAKSQPATTVESTDTHKTGAFFENLFDIQSLYLSENTIDSEIPCLCAELKLLLKDNYEVYVTTMQNWFAGILDRESYANQIRQCVPSKALQYHNQLVFAILKRSFNFSHENLENSFDHTDLTLFYKAFDCKELPSAKQQQQSLLDGINSTNDISNATKLKEDPEEDDDDVVVINKNKKKKRKRYQILDDDDEDELESSHAESDNVTTRRPPSSNNNDTLNHLKRKRRKTNVIVSDDEDDANSSSMFGTESSNSNAVVDEEPKSIDVKSTGLLKTTLTINRNSFRDSLGGSQAPRNAKSSSSSLLDQLLSSDTPISLLPNSDSNSKVPSSPVTHSNSSFNNNSLSTSPLSNQSKVAPIQNSNLSSNSTITESTNSAKHTKAANSSLIEALNSPSSANINISKPIVLKPALLKQCLISKSQSQLSGNSPDKKNNKRLKSSSFRPNNNLSGSPNSNSSDSILLPNDNSNQHLSRVSSKGSSLLNKSYNDETVVASQSPATITTASSSNVNSKIIELLNRKSSSNSSNHNHHSHSLSTQQHVSSQNRLKTPSALEALLNSSNSTPPPDKEQSSQPQDSNKNQWLCNGNDNHSKYSNKSNSSNGKKKRSKKSSTALKKKVIAPTVEEYKEHLIHEGPPIDTNSSCDDHFSDTTTVYMTNGFTTDLIKSVNSFEKHDPLIYERSDDGMISNVEFNEKQNSGDNDGEIHKNNNEEKSPIIERDPNVIKIERLPPEERINDKLKTCFQEVCLPDNVRLGLRIQEIAYRHELTTIDNKVTMLCNIALKNFMKNMISQLVTARSSFFVHNNGVRHHAGSAQANPYLCSSYRTLTGVPSQSNPIESTSLLLRETASLNPSNYLYKHYECQISQPAKLDAELRPKKFGLGKNMLKFSHCDQASLEAMTKSEVKEEEEEEEEGLNDKTSKKPIIVPFRPVSGILYKPDSQPMTSATCNLRHLFNVIKTYPEMIPVHQVRSSALYRTIAAFNNVSDNDDPNQ